MRTEPKYLTLKEENFRALVLESDVPVLVGFSAGWCGPCRALTPVIDELAADFEGIARVGKVDLDGNPALVSEYDIHSIPSLLFFQNGALVERLTGPAPKNVLAEKLEALAALTAPRDGR